MEQAAHWGCVCHEQGKGPAKKGSGAISAISKTVNAARMAKRQHQGAGAAPGTAGGGSGEQGTELQRMASKSAQSFADRESHPPKGLLTSQSSKMQRAESCMSFNDRCA